MGMPPIHEPYARQWVAIYSIEPINTSIIAWNKTIEGSSNDIIPCMALEALTRQPVFVVLLTNCGTISVLAPLWENQPHSQSNEELFLIGLLP
jgi:hypothetical protein